MRGGQGHHQGPPSLPPSPSPSPSLSLSPSFSLSLSLLSFLPPSLLSPPSPLSLLPLPSSPSPLFVFSLFSFLLSPRPPPLPLSSLPWLCHLCFLSSLPLSLFPLFIVSLFFCFLLPVLPSPFSLSPFSLRFFSSSIYFLYFLTVPGLFSQYHLSIIISLSLPPSSSLSISPPPAPPLFYSSHSLLYISSPSRPLQSRRADYYFVHSSLSSPISPFLSTAGARRATVAISR